MSRVWLLLLVFMVLLLGGCSVQKDGQSVGVDANNSSSQDDALYGRDDRLADTGEMIDQSVAEETGSSNASNKTLIFLSELEFVRHARADDCYVQVKDSVYDLTPVIDWYPVSEHITANILDQITSSCARARPDAFFESLFPELHETIKNLTYLGEINRSVNGTTNGSSS